MVILFLPIFTVKGAPQYATIFPLVTQGCPRQVFSRKYGKSNAPDSRDSETASRFVLWSSRSDLTAVLHI